MLEFSIRTVYLTNRSWHLEKNPAQEWTELAGI